MGQFQANASSDGLLGKTFQEERKTRFPPPLLCIGEELER